VATNEVKQASTKTGKRAPTKMGKRSASSPRQIIMPELDCDSQLVPSSSEGGSSFASGRRAVLYLNIDNAAFRNDRETKERLQLGIDTRKSNTHELAFFAFGLSTANIQRCEGLQAASRSFRTWTIRQHVRVVPRLSELLDSCEYTALESPALEELQIRIG
jgi:hypothetical protein